MSDRTARRLGRILSMVPWVIANPGTTVEEVCERFGYSKRELMSDLDLVFVCGLPGYGPGDLMVAYIDDDEVVVDMADYFARPFRLNPAEALSLLAAGMALTSTGQAPPALERAVAKLAAVVAPDVDEALVVDLAGAEPDLLDTLRRGAAEHRVVEIVYTALSSGETKGRRIEPWAVFSALGNWYVSAHCRSAGAERVFRVDRIRSAELTGDSFVPPEEPPLPEVRYTPSEDDVRATIRLGPRARWVGEYYPVEVLDDEGLVVFSASDPAVAARLLLRLGPDAELVEGDEVGKALVATRAAILARYDD